MTKTIQISEEEARALVSILQAVTVELGKVRHELRATGHDKMVLCSDEFSEQLHELTTLLEGNLYKARLAPMLPEFDANNLN